MTARVSEQMQVALPLDVCAELGIEPGVQLQFRAREGKLEAVKVATSEAGVSTPTLAEIYTPERDTEEAAIQKGCSSKVPDDFPA